MKFSSALVLSSLVSATLARGFASHEKSNLLARQNRQGGGGGGGFRPPPQNGRPPQNGGGNGRPPQNGGGKPPAQPPKPSAKPPATQPGKPATPPPATGGGGGGGGINAGELCLKPENIQLGSNNDGTSNKSVKFSVAAIKSASNHINHCSDVRPDLRKTNGTQSNEASCNGIPLGFVPSVNNIPSATVVFPKNLEQVPANTDFTFKVKIANFQAGSFTSAAETYYASPCQGNKDGNAIGHTHVVAKKMSSYQDISIRDVTKFDFFLGVDTGPGADGNLEAPVKGGFAVGFYRVSTITSCETHQMINGPRAQRDTIEGSSIFEVVAAGGAPAPAPGNGASTPAPPAPAPGTGGGNAGGQPPKQCKRRRKAKRLAQRALEMEVAAL